MSEATNYLDNVASGARTAGSGSSEEHIVIGADRLITVPDSLKKLGVQYDHNIETVTFDCPRYWDEHDMSQMDIFVNITRADGRSFQTACSAARTNTSNNKLMHFDWTIPLGVTEVSGFVSFLVCIQESVIHNPDDPDTLSVEITKHWNSEICTECYISPGIETDVVPSGPSENQTGYILKELNNVKSSITGINSSLLGRIGALEDKLGDLPQYALSVSSFTIIPSLHEVGDTVSSVICKWSLQNDDSVVSIQIKYGSKVVNINNVTTTQYVLTNLSLTSATTFTLTVTDNKGKTASKSATIQFGYYVYYGVASRIEEVSEVTSTFVNELTSDLRTSRASSITATPGADEYIYYIHPKSFGTCSFYDEQGYDVGMDLVGEATISSVVYYVYRSQYASLGNIIITIR